MEGRLPSFRVIIRQKPRGKTMAGLQTCSRRRNWIIKPSESEATRGHVQLAAHQKIIHFGDEFGPFNEKASKSILGEAVQLQWLDQTCANLYLYYLKNRRAFRRQPIHGPFVQPSSRFADGRHFGILVPRICTT
jgi:hypothetical protein